MNRDTRTGNHADNNSAGFSLIEVLLAVFLLSLITVLVMYALRGGGAVTKRMQQVTEQSAIWTVQRYLRDALHNTRGIQIPGTSLGETTVLLGKRSDLKFVTGHNVPGQFGGLYVTQLSLKPSPRNVGMYDLWVDQELFHRHGEVFGKARDVAPQTRVLRDIVDMEITYFGRHKRNDPLTWHNSWIDRERLPNLISINIQFDSNDTRTWPLMLTSVPVAQ